MRYIFLGCGCPENMGFAVRLESETGNVWATAWVRTQTPLGWGRLSGLASHCSARYTLPAGLGAGVPRALGEMGLVSAFGDRVQGEGAGSELNLLRALWRWLQPCRPAPRPSLEAPWSPPRGSACRSQQDPRAPLTSRLFTKYLPLSAESGPRVRVVLKEVSGPWLA